MQNQNYVAFNFTPQGYANFSRWAGENLDSEEFSMKFFFNEVLNEMHSMYEHGRDITDLHFKFYEDFTKSGRVEFFEPASGDLEGMVREGQYQTICWDHPGKLREADREMKRAKESARADLLQSGSVEIVEDTREGCALKLYAVYTANEKRKRITLWHASESEALDEAIWVLSRIKYAM